MSTTMSRDNSTLVRFDKDLWEAIKEIAKENRRPAIEELRIWVEEKLESLGRLPGSRKEGSE